MKKILIATLVLFVQHSHAQSFADKSSFVVMGCAQNPRADAFEFTVTGFWSNRLSKVTLDKKGAFEFKKTFEGRQQTVYFYLNHDVVTFTVKNGDTLVLNWDDSGFRDSFKASSPQPLANKLFRLQCQQYLNFQERFRKIQQIYFWNTQQDLRSSVKALFNQELAFLSAMTDNDVLVFKTLFVDLYFKYAAVLSGNFHQLSVDLEPALKKALNGVDIEKPDSSDFLTSYNYRRFLLKQAEVSGFNVFTEPDTNYAEKMVSVNWIKTVADVSLINDWCIVSAVMSGLDPFNQKKAGDIYKKIEARITTPGILEKLDQYLSNFTGINPGQQAPHFTLKDSLGHDISLADFKGKVVYLDFWGVGCSPCIYDITNHGSKLHQRYKDKDVVFVSVCVDAEKQEWKQAVKKYDMKHQVNLIAEGWSDHPVVQQYSASSLPTYIIIGRDGRVVDNSAQQMGELLNSAQNRIDQALMVYSEY